MSLDNGDLVSKINTKLPWLYKPGGAREELSTCYTSYLPINVKDELESSSSDYFQQSFCSYTKWNALTKKSIDKEASLAVLNENNSPSFKDIKPDSNTNSIVFIRPKVQFSPRLNENKEFWIDDIKVEPIETYLNLFSELPTVRVDQTNEPGLVNIKTWPYDSYHCSEHSLSVQIRGNSL